MYFVLKYRLFLYFLNYLIFNTQNFLNMNTTKTTTKTVLTETQLICPTLGVAKEKTTSLLVAIKKDINSTIESNTRSVSSYFSEFRKNYRNIESWLKEANNKGRTFDTEKIHTIINVGKLALIIEADKLLQTERDQKALKEGKKFTSPQNWSANRMFVAFVKAVETTKKAK